MLATLQSSFSLVSAGFHPMQHPFLNHLFLHFQCIKVLCLSPTSVFFAGDLPPPECHSVPNSSLCLFRSVCLSLLCSLPHPTSLSLSISLSLQMSPPVSLSYVSSISQKHPHYFSTSPILLLNSQLFTQIHPPPPAPLTVCLKTPPVLFHAAP